MKYQIGDRVELSWSRSEGSFRIVAAVKCGPWWEYTLAHELTGARRERVAETSLVAASFVFHRQT